jgi:hypothetical protein
MPPKKTTPAPESPAAPAQQAKPRSSKNWKVIDTAGMSEEQRKAVIDKALATGKPARKAGEKVHNVAPENKKAAKIPRQDTSTVKSGAKAPHQEPATTTRARTREKRPCVELTDALAGEIIEQVYESSLIDVLRKDGMPSYSTFMRRLARDSDLAKRYGEAMDARADKLALEIIQIADDGSNDTYLDEEGNKRTDHDVVARSKLRVDARKWAAAKMAPKKYGDKVDLNHGGQADNPLVTLLGRISGTALPIASNVPDDDE